MPPSTPVSPSLLATPVRDANASPGSPLPSVALGSIVFGPERPETSSKHFKLSEAWLAAMQPLTRLRIRCWLRICLCRHLGRGPDGRPLFSVNTPVAYARRAALHAISMTSSSTTSAVAGQVSFAARSGNAMRRTLRETTPTPVPSGDDPMDNFVLCVRHVAGYTLTPMQRVALHCLFCTNSKEKHFGSSSRLEPASCWSFLAPGSCFVASIWWCTRCWC